MMWAIAVLALFFGFIEGSRQFDSCFTPGECLSGITIGGKEVASAAECLQLCTSTDGKLKNKFQRDCIIIYHCILGCAWFTFYPSSNYCNLMDGCDNVSTEECNGKHNDSLINPLSFSNINLYSLFKW